MYLFGFEYVLARMNGITTDVNVSGSGTSPFLSSIALRSSVVSHLRSVEISLLIAFSNCFDTTHLSFFSSYFRCSGFVSSKKLTSAAS